MIRAKIFLPKFEIATILQAKGIRLVDTKPDILHYTGDSLDELKKLIKIDKPDLVISHSIRPDFNLKVFQVYHPVKNPNEFLRPAKIVTNCHSLSLVYYKRLGINTDIEVLKPKIKDTPSGSGVDFLLKVLIAWNRFKEWMMWA